MADRRSPSRSVLVVGALALAVGVGLGVGTSPVLAGLGVAAVGLALLVLWRPLLGILALAATLVLGQLVRIPAFGGAGAMLPSDLLIPAVVVAWLLRRLHERRLAFSPSPLAWPVATVTLVLLLTFLAGTSQLPFLLAHERLSSVFYLLRWLEYVLLIFVVADVVRDQRAGRRIVFALVGSAVIVALLGFAQLRVFPDFSSMVPQGWDPHIGRLLSTWFDPNFLGGFLAFMIAILVGLASVQRGRTRLLVAGAALVLGAALLLTYSRSSYAALLAAIVVLGVVRTRRLLLVVLLAGLVAYLAVPRVQERVQGALRLDATARLRIVSWQNALTVVRDHPLTGIGYNTYRYVQVDYGFQPDAAEHSAGGSDSSLLTILVTAGPFGLVAYLWFLWAMATLAWSSYRRGMTPFVRGLGLGALAGLASVVAHSFFINSLLYPHTMLVFALVFGTLAAARGWPTEAERAA